MAGRDAAAPGERSDLRHPLYVQIAAKLRERIVHGTYPVASLLPTEADLGEEFATSRNTVREALRRLVEQGLVRRRQGAGTVVISTAPTTRYFQSFSNLEDLFANARNTHYVLNTIARVTPAPAVADLIGAVAGSEWLLVTGVRWTERGGTPIAFVESYIPAEFHDIVQTFWDVRLPFYQVLEEGSGRTIEEVVQEIRAVEMPRRVANAFGLAEASLSLQLLRRYVARAGILITSINWHRADQFTYQMQIHRRVENEAT